MGLLTSPPPNRPQSGPPGRLPAGGQAGFLGAGEIAIPKLIGSGWALWNQLDQDAAAKAKQAQCWRQGSKSE